MPGGLLAKNAFRPLNFFFENILGFFDGTQNHFSAPGYLLFPAAAGTNIWRRSGLVPAPTVDVPAPPLLAASCPSEAAFMMAQTVAPRARNCSSCQLFLQDSWDEFCKWVDECLERPLIIYCVSATSHIYRKLNFTLQHENNCSKLHIWGKFPWKPKQTQWSNFREIPFSLTDVIS